MRVGRVSLGKVSQLSAVLASEQEHCNTQQFVISAVWNAERKGRRILSLRNLKNKEIWIIFFLNLGKWKNESLVQYNSCLLLKTQSALHNTLLCHTVDWSAWNEHACIFVYSSVYSRPFFSHSPSQFKT